MQAGRFTASFALALTFSATLGGCEKISGLDDIQPATPPAGDASCDDGGTDAIDAAPERAIDAPDGMDGGSDRPDDGRDVGTNDDGAPGDAPGDDGARDTFGDAAVDALDGAQESGACDPTGGAHADAYSMVPGGEFVMGSDRGGGLEQARPAHSATVGAFLLQPREVTVGRFREFVRAYECFRPQAGAGAVQGVKGGWDPDWKAVMPRSVAALSAELASCGPASTFSALPGASEAQPINCVTWYEAFAFCVWDGGRLPAESEWEFAAAGGKSQRIFPTGNAAPTLDLANFNGERPSDVGSRAGLEPYFMKDLAGNVAEWVIDSAGPYAEGACAGVACVVTEDGNRRGARGGSWNSRSSDELLTSLRTFEQPTTRSAMTGVRCANEGSYAR